jgi:alpha-glucosidase
MNCRWWTAGAVLVAALIVVPRLDANAATPRTWLLTAPGGAGGPTANVRLDQSGRLALAVGRAGSPVLDSSALGIRTAAADLSTGLTFTTRTDLHVTDRYATAVGRRRQHTVDANQTTLSFRKGSSRVDLVFRVSTDGVAYRYVVRQSGTVTVTSEASEFAVPTTARAYLLPFDNGRDDYENIPVHTTVAQAAPVAYGYPALFHVGASWLLLTESNVNGGYGASRVTLDGTTHRFRLTLPDPQETNPGTLTTPWRTMVVGDLATVTGSDLVTDLAAPSKVADTSWIRPGRSEWSWWSDSTSSKNLAAQEKAADFAAKMGWEYILVDAGWSATWMPTLVDYARARHVGVWIWTSFSALDTATERNAKLPLWKSWGVAGLKIDFVQSDGQARTKWYDAIAAATAQNKLMVEFHGCTIPRGIERTWPHVMTMEGVDGAEHIHDKPGRNPFPADYYTTLPFTRNLAGSMDYTPVTFTAKRTNTDAAELAQSVVFESGLQNYAGSVAEYDARPVAERLLRQVPSVWDETRLLSGDPDSHVILARRNGSGWFVGAISAGPARTFTVPLDFLGAGNWLADVFADGATGLTLTTRPVTAGDSLSVATLTQGGFTVHLCPAAAGATSCG